MRIARRAGWCWLVGMIWQASHRLLSVVCGLTLASLASASAELDPKRMQPTVDQNHVFEEVDGVVAVEAEHFFQQSENDVRGWYLTNKDQQAGPAKPGDDADPAHVTGASGGAYLECLPDTRHNHGHKLINGENFANTPGVMAILSYQVRSTTQDVTMCGCALTPLAQRTMGCTWD